MSFSFEGGAQSRNAMRTPHFEIAPLTFVYLPDLRDNQMHRSRDKCRAGSRDQQCWTSTTQTCNAQCITWRVIYCERLLINHECVVFPLCFDLQRVRGLSM